MSKLLQILTQLAILKQLLFTESYFPSKQTKHLYKKMLILLTFLLTEFPDNIGDAIISSKRQCRTTPDSWEPVAKVTTCLQISLVGNERQITWQTLFALVQCFRLKDINHISGISRSFCFGQFWISLFHNAQYALSDN